MKEIPNTPVTEEERARSRAACLEYVTAAAALTFGEEPITVTRDEEHTESAIYDAMFADGSVIKLRAICIIATTPDALQEPTQ